MNTDLLKKIAAACEHFISNYQQALPRVARRGMEPVLDAVTELFTFSMEKEDIVMQAIPVFEYKYNPRTKRRDDNISEEYYVGFVVYIPSSKAFGWRLLPTKASILEMVALFDALPTFRVVTLEELVEIHITPMDLVSYIKNVSLGIISSHEFYEAMKKANHPMARA